MRPSCLIPDRERGAVLVLFTVGMLAIIAIAGLALDTGHAFLNKTRLQNALDAGALSGARTLSDSAGVIAAQASAFATFNRHLAGEMGAASPTVVPIVEFSATLIPFIPGASNTNAKFIRLRVPNFSISVWLARVLPGVGNKLSIGGSAVAGPSAPLGSSPEDKICDIVPMMVCAGAQPGGGYDTDCSDGSCFGYSVGASKEITLKTGSGNKNWDVGPGNFQLISLDCGPGASCVREALAGKYPGCAVNGQSVTTKPGNNVGPVAQGLNTRFGEYLGPMKNDAQNYPPDAVTFSSSGFWYGDYQARLKNGPYNYTPVEQGGTGVPKRRVVTVPLGNCTGATNGRGTVQVVGFGCFFLTRPAEQTGSQQVYGQFIDNCRATGEISENPGSSSSAYKIVLYKDPDGGDS